jgi:hypothetical protein
MIQNYQSLNIAGGHTDNGRKIAGNNEKTKKNWGILLFFEDFEVF